MMTAGITRPDAWCRPCRSSPFWSGHEVDDLVRAASGSNSPEFASCIAQHVAGVFDHGDLHAQADAEIGDAVVPGHSCAAGSSPQCRGRQSRRAPECRRTPARISSAVSGVSSSRVHPVDVHTARRVHSPRGAALPPRTDTHRAARRICPRGRCVTVCGLALAMRSTISLPFGQVAAGGSSDASSRQTISDRVRFSPASAGPRTAWAGSGFR